MADDAVEQRTLETSKGHRFEGFATKEGLPHGQGKMFYKTGEVFVGEFRWGERVQGDMVYSDGVSRYTGAFEKGKKSGEGRMQYRNGDVYIGEWKNGLFDGQGTYRFSQGGELFEGVYAQNCRVKGKYTYSSDGSYYDGEFSKDEKNEFHGQGMFYYREGEIYRDQQCRNQV